MSKETAGFSANSNPMLSMFSGLGGMFGMPYGGGMMSGAEAGGGMQMGMRQGPQDGTGQQMRGSAGAGGMPQWMGGVQGAGGASANNVFGTPLGQSMLADIMNASLAAQAYEPSQLTTDMMAAGRPSFNWGLMGAVAPLAGAMPQPEYSTPPPEFSTRYWKEYEPS